MVAIWILYPKAVWDIAYGILYALCNAARPLLYLDVSLVFSQNPSQEVCGNGRRGPALTAWCMSGNQLGICAPISLPRGQTARGGQWVRAHACSCAHRQQTSYLHKQIRKPSPHLSPPAALETEPLNSLMPRSGLPPLWRRSSLRSWRAPARPCPRP